MQANTETGANQRPEKFARKSNCRSDPFTVADGRYIGHDGFAVPRDCDEFLQRFPNYVRNWVARRLDMSALQRDVEDWAQDLITHLKYLPEKSRYRVEGKQDVIQTFDPGKMHGANEARFRSYINLCLANRFKTLYVQRMKNPVCRTDNLSLSGGADCDGQDMVDDEFCHQGSACLQAAAMRSRKQHDDRLLVAEFIRFASRCDPVFLTAIEAIAQTGTAREAARLIRVPDKEFARLRYRLRQVGKCFLAGQAVPKRQTPTAASPFEKAGKIQSHEG